MEVWGAQGGVDERGGNFNFGTGGYSIGHINWLANQTLYVIVGGQGKIGNMKDIGYTGGYNGGGSSRDSNHPTYTGKGGGGMTHISFKSNPVLNEQTWNPDGTIIAAGGGGSDDDGRPLAIANLSRWSINAAGSGGGFKGNDTYDKENLPKLFLGSGANTTVTSINYQVQGLGQSSYNYDAGCGGGGWYGGRTPNLTDAGGGGGSGYIGHASLYNKHMAGYQVETSNATETKTISVNVASNSPISDTAKKGDGYALITWIPVL